MNRLIYRLHLKSFFVEGLWVDFFIPVHHIISILIVFLKTNKVFENDDTTSIVEMMTWDVFISFHSLSHSSSVTFQLPSFISVWSKTHGKNEFQPEISIFWVVEISIIVHWESWHCSLEIIFISPHEMLEFYSILSSNSVSISVIEIHKIMDSWRMESAWRIKSFTSEISSVSTRDTTIIETKIIDIILCSLFSKFVYSLLSIWSSNWLWFRRKSSFISTVSTKHHIQLFFSHCLVKMRILLSGQIKSSSRFFDRKNLISFNDISEFFNIWVIVRCITTSGSNIRMMFLSQSSISVFNLFLGRKSWNIEDSIVILFQLYLIHCSELSWIFWEKPN